MKISTLLHRPIILGMVFFLFRLRFDCIRLPLLSSGSQMQSNRSRIVAVTTALATIHARDQRTTRNICITIGAFRFRHASHRSAWNWRKRLTELLLNWHKRHFF